MKEVKPNNIFEAAYKLAQTSDYGRFRLGAIVAIRRTIISMGTNSKKSHPLQARFTHRPHLNCWRHAEVHAISLARKDDLKDSDVYVARLLMSGERANSRPCLGCTNALLHHGVKGAYFYEDGKYYYDELDHK